jgi:hypothetical protein
VDTSFHLDNRHDIWSNLSFHSVYYARESLKIWGKEISESNGLYRQMKRLLHPSTQYFRGLHKLEDYDGQWIHSPIKVTHAKNRYVWTIDWDEDLTDNDASLFLGLLFITDNPESPLLSRFIKEVDIEALFRNRILLKMECRFLTYKNRDWNSIQRTSEFDGPLIETLVQCLDSVSRHFQNLLANYTGVYELQPIYNYDLSDWLSFVRSS